MVKCLIQKGTGAFRCYSYKKLIIASCQQLCPKLYIDLYGQGIDVATKQIIDVISGNNTYKQRKCMNIFCCKGYKCSPINQEMYR